MRTRIIIAVSAVAAAAIGVTVWATTRPAQPAASPLTGTAALTCPAGQRDCTSPGSIRWSLPQPGSYYLNQSAGLLTSATSEVAARQVAATARITSSVQSPSLTPQVTVADGMVFYQQGGLVEAIDASTGKPSWRTVIRRRPALPPGCPAGGQRPPACKPRPLPLWNVVDDPPAVAGTKLVVTAIAAGATQARAWQLDAATGALGPSLTLGQYMYVMTPARDGLVVGAGSDGIEALDWASGSVLWQATALLPGAPLPILGDVLYTVDGTRGIERLDLDGGRRLADLPLAPSLRGSVLYLAQGSAAMFAGTTAMQARIDPATGRVLWAVHGNFSSGPVAVSGAIASAPPSVWYLSFPSRSCELVTVDVTTGQQVSSATLSLAREEQFLAGRLLPGTTPLLYDSQILTSQPPKPASAAVATWLEGLNPGTWRPDWTGPAMSGDLEVLGWTPAGPPEIIAEACAPAGVVMTSSTCTAARLVAVNA